MYRFLYAPGLGETADIFVNLKMVCLFGEIRFCIWRIGLSVVVILTFRMRTWHWVFGNLLSWMEAEMCTTWFWHQLSSSAKFVQLRSRDSHMENISCRTPCRWPAALSALLPDSQNTPIFENFESQILLAPEFSTTSQNHSAWASASWSEQW